MSENDGLNQAPPRLRQVSKVKWRFHHATVIPARRTVPWPAWPGALTSAAGLMTNPG
jgi:hypothetical protein